MPDIPKIAALARPRSSQAQAAIEAGIAEFAAVKEDRDNIRADYDRAMELCTQAKHTIIGLQNEIGDLKSRCTGYQLERDEAVVRHGKLQGLFASVLAQLRAFEIPSVPVIRQTVAGKDGIAGKDGPDVEAPKLAAPPTHKQMSALIGNQNKTPAV
jgi:hypothetical protein